MPWEEPLTCLKFFPIICFKPTLFKIFVPSNFLLCINPWPLTAAEFNPRWGAYPFDKNAECPRLRNVVRGRPLISYTVGSEVKRPPWKCTLLCGLGPTHYIRPWYAHSQIETIFFQLSCIICYFKSFVLIFCLLLFLFLLTFYMYEFFRVHTLKKLPWAAYEFSRGPGPRFNAFLVL
jgi:hypothetical protein